MTTLNIIGFDLDNNNKPVNITLKSSNAYMMIEKYNKAVEPLHIEEYTLENNMMRGGNKGLNAGAYLCELMEELTGFDLA